MTVALAMIEGIEAQIAPLDKELRAYAHRQAGCKALMAHCGIGPLVAVTILADLGDCTRFSSSRLAVRYAGMDITVYQSDQRRAPGHLSPRQGPPAWRWALFEAARSAWGVSEEPCKAGRKDRLCLLLQSLVLITMRSGPARRSWCGSGRCRGCRAVVGWTSLMR